MDARQLEYFLAVVDHGGFGRAAESLYLTQPSLSQAIASLERELGVTLFHRIGRRAVLNKAGAELIGPARQVVRDLATARAAMDSVTGLQRGLVEIVTMPSPGVEPLGRLTREFSRRHPGLSVRVDAVFTADDVVDRVRQGAAEIGLVGAPEALAPPGVSALPLETQGFVVVEPPLEDEAAHAEAGPVTSAVLAGARVIVSSRGSVMRQIVDDAVAAGADVRVVAEVAHPTSILPLVLQGVGLAILPASWASLARRGGARVRRLSPAPQLHVTLVARAASPTPAAQAFLRVAQTYADTREGAELRRPF